MNISIAKDHHLEVIKFLYQFKDDNKFYKVDENLLNATSTEEKFNLLYTLRDNALIATDRELHYSHYSNEQEVRAKILPKGIQAVEAYTGD